MEQAAASDVPAVGSPRRHALVAAGSLLATGVALAAAFFPLFFNKWAAYDDEGVFEVGVRELLAHHGHLYSTIWSDLYGPFYDLFMSTVYRLIHQQPDLANSRWILRIITTASAALCGAAVWRVAKNLPCSILAEVAVFLLLAGVGGSEAAHPGGLEVLLVSVIVFALASYAAQRRTGYLVATGAATSALTMTKVNAGGFVAIIGALQRKLRAGERVCILRSSFPFVVTPPNNQLGHLLKKFSTVVARAGTYTISRHRMAPRKSSSTTRRPRAATG